MMRDEASRFLESLCSLVGEKFKRGGLRDTPRRMEAAWRHWCGGYAVDVPGLFTTFTDGAEGYDEIIAVRRIPFFSHCEHHLAPFFGDVTVGYIPGPLGRIVGLSKLARVVDAYARRLQVQERLTRQIADAVTENLHPDAVGVVVTARHLCMESRGVRQIGCSTVTSVVRGAFRESPAAKAEFMGLAR